MSQLRTFISSSVGRKAVMAVTGLLLVGFLITHVAANLMVLFDAEAYNHYSHALVANPLIYLAEAALLALFVGHFVSGFVVERSNRAARPVAYASRQRAGTPSRKSLASSTMILSGVVVLVFVPLHIITFKFGTYYASVADPSVRDLHRLVVEVFQKPGYVVWYEFALLVLGFHAWHGISSALDSLGVGHRSWLANGCRGLAVAIFAGFLLIPVAIYVSQGAAS